MKPRVALTMLGGLGDTLMLTMPARRLKELNPNIEIVAYGRKDSVCVLNSNPLFSDIRIKKDWTDFPIHNSEFDVVMDFRYSVKTFVLKENTIKFDKPIEKILKLQKKYELDLWVNDIVNYRMVNWQRFLHSSDLRKRGMNWYEIISYLSGLKFNTSYLSVELQTVNDLPDEFVAVSIPCSLSRGYVKNYPSIYYDTIFKAMPSIKFVLLGEIPVKAYKYSNVTHLQGKLSINQTAFVLKKAKLLLSEEGGLVHIAKAVGTKSIVMFGPTQKWFFEYRDNINLKEETDCEYCHNQIPFWNIKCVKFNSVYCKNLLKLTPEIVINALKKELYDSDTAVNSCDSLIITHHATQ